MQFHGVGAACGIQITKPISMSLKRSMQVSEDNLGMNLIENAQLLLKMSVLLKLFPFFSSY